MTKPPLPPFGDDAFPSPARSEWLTARLGRLLGIAVTICFLTGLISHFHQHPVGWLPLPADPAWGYRVSQGLHVATGFAALPLFFAKIWSVYPLLFAWPPARSVTHAIERGTVALLVGATFFELFTGVFNVAHLYVWPFFFPSAHYAVAWVVMGSVVLHLAVKWPTIVRALRRRETASDGSPPHVAVRPPTEAAASGGISRRVVLWGAAGAAGVVTLTTVGQTLPPLDLLGMLAPRSPGDLPTGMPINRTAGAAGVITLARESTYRLQVVGPTPQTFTLTALHSLQQTEVLLPIACVEGWSAVGRWTGVRLRDLLDASGVPEGATVRVVSLEQGGLYGAAEVPPNFARHPDTLLATGLGGLPLTLDHGYPVRLIAPNRPGVLQTKWVTRVEVV